MKISREPALFVGLLAAICAVVVSFEVEWLTPGAAAALVALVGGAVTAFTTRPVAPALFAGLVGAGAALLAEYGLHVPKGTVAALTSAVVAAFALFVRTQVTPAYDRAPTAPKEGPVR